MKRTFIFCSAVVTSLLFICGCSRSTPVEEISADKGSASFEELPEVEVKEGDWPWWRGPGRNGIAGEQRVPREWNEERNVVWKSPVPGRGHSSPTVIGDRLFLATADESEEIQSVIGYDRNSGEQLWHTEIHRGNFESSKNIHRKNSHASCSIASDGERLFVAFLNGGAIWVTALDFEGNQIWQTKAGPFDSKFGYAPSPSIYRSMVIIAADHRGGGFLAALHRKSGEIVWRKPRPAVATYSSPLIASVAGKDQLLISGCDLVGSYDPKTGEEIWSVKGTTEATVGTMVYQDDMVFASGGYPGKETLCVRADGSEEVLWRNDQKAYVPSALAYDGYLYLVSDKGIAYCWEAKTGERAWRARVGGNFSSSPVLAGGHIYISSEKGKTVVFRADPEKFEKVAENQLGNVAFASPVICGDQIFLRTALERDGKREETLYCIAHPEEKVEQASR